MLTRELRYQSTVSAHHHPCYMFRDASPERPETAWNFRSLNVIGPPTCPTPIHPLDISIQDIIYLLWISMRCTMWPHKINMTSPTRFATTRNSRRVGPLDIGSLLRARACAVTNRNCCPGLKPCRKITRRGACISPVLLAGRIGCLENMHHPRPRAGRNVPSPGTLRNHRDIPDPIRTNPPSRPAPPAPSRSTSPAGPKAMPWTDVGRRVTPARDRPISAGHPQRQDQPLR